MTVIFVVMGVATLAAAACGSTGGQPPGATKGDAAPPPTGQVPAFVPSEKAPPVPAVLPALPSDAFPAARPPDVVTAVYEFAARHPEVLRYVPCFCGCERSGHRDNEDCFIKGRTADGQVAWDPHGAT
jgi:hypothetical protein